MLLSNIENPNQSLKIEKVWHLQAVAAKVKRYLAVVRDFRVESGEKSRFVRRPLARTRVWHHIASGTPSGDRLYMRTVDARWPPLLMAALCFDGRLNNLPLNCAWWLSVCRLIVSFCPELATEVPSTEARLPRCPAVSWSLSLLTRGEKSKCDITALRILSMSCSSMSLTTISNLLTETTKVRMSSDASMHPRTITYKHLKILLYHDVRFIIRIARSTQHIKYDRLNKFVIHSQS